MKTVHELSAGGVAFARDPVRIALIRVRSPRGDARWVLPKGLIEPGETPEAAARREVREESGFEVELAGHAGEIEYWFVLDGVRHHKKVVFYAMWITGGDPGTHDHEVEAVELFQPDEAMRAMAHESERGVAREALALVTT